MGSHCKHSGQRTQPPLESERSFATVDMRNPPYERDYTARPTP